MSKDTIKNTNSQVTSTRTRSLDEIKSEIRRNKLGQTSGPLSMPKHLAKPGYRYFAANISPKSNEIEAHRRLGWEIVTDPDMAVGDRGLTTGHAFGSGILVNLGKDSSGVPMEGILMEIPEELYQVSLDVDRERQQRIDEELGHAPQGMDSVFKFEQNE